MKEIISSNHKENQDLKILIKSLQESNLQLSLEASSYST